MLRSEQKSATNAWLDVLLVMTPGIMNHDLQDVAALSNSDYLCTSRKSK